jgi:hypothetical protein
MVVLTFAVFINFSDVNLDEFEDSRGLPESAGIVL